MADLAGHELVLVIHQNADCARLIQLDDVWTSMAVTARPDATEDLAVIIEEMKPLIYRVSEQSGPVHEIAEEHVEILDVALRELLSSDHLTAADRTDLLWLLRRRRRDSVAEILQGAAQALADPDTEAHDLDAQLRAIGEGQVVAGDLSKKFRCGLSLSLIGGSILTLPSAAAAGFGVMAVGGAAAGVTGMFLTGGVGGIALLAAGLIVARRNGC